MKLEAFIDYVKSCENLTDIAPKISLGEDGDFYVVESKETYVYDNELDAATKLNDVRQDPGYKSSEKKFKAGKVNKAGEEIRPDTWIVITKVRP